MNSYQVEDHGDKGRVRHGSPLFYDLLQEMAETHDKKSHDYASDDNPAGNYHFAGQMALLFSHSSEDAGFFGRMAEKIYRLSNLEKSNKIAKNETIDDTERDICVIATLWMSDRRNRRNRAGRPMQIQNMTTEQYRQRSEDTACQMISMVQMLTPEDVKQMRDYLTSCLRDVPKERYGDVD